MKLDFEGHLRVSLCSADAGTKCLPGSRFVSPDVLRELRNGPLHAHFLLLLM